MKKHFIRLSTILLFAFSFLFISCQTQEDRLYLNNSISYYEADQYATIYDVRAEAARFHVLQQENRKNLSGLLTNEEDNLWLKIDFKLPDNMKFKSLGLYISQLRSASEIWLNGRFLGSAGEMRPNEFSYGFKATSYLLPENMLIQDNENTIFIKLWTGPIGFISDSIYITSPQKAKFRASKDSFFNSQIFLGFGMIMLLVTIYYLILFFMQKDHPHNMSYLMFSFLAFSGFLFIVPFFASEISWINTSFISYLTFIKFNFCTGAYLSTYFATSFVKNFLQENKRKSIEILRIVILFLQVIPTFLVPTYTDLFKIAPYLIALLVLQVLFILDSIIRTLRNPEKRKIAINLLVGFTPVGISVIIDFILRILIQNKTMPYFTLYGWQMTIFVFLIYLIVDFNLLYLKNIDLTDQLKELNWNLEEEVQKRTHDLTTTNQFLAEQVAQTNEDLKTARFVQQGLLPEKNISFNGWDISVMYQPLNNVSGNFYDYYHNNNNLDGIGLFDVNNHGTSAGLLTMLTKTIVSQTFYSEYSSKPVSEILYDINRSIIANENQVAKYISGNLIKINKFEDDDSCTVEISSASAPDCLYYDAEKETTTLIQIPQNDSDSYLGSLNSTISYNQHEIRMRNNDALILITSGVLNCANSQNVKFNPMLFSDILQRYKFETAQKIQTAITNSLETFIGNAQIKDDISIIVMKRFNSEKLFL